MESYRLDSNRLEVQRLGIRRSHQQHRCPAVKAGLECRRWLVCFRQEAQEARHREARA